MPAPPTLADFFRIALFDTVPADLRRGQYASNVLSRMRPDIAKATTDTAADPFYLDERMPEFLAQVAVLWCEIPDDAEIVAEKGRVYRSALRAAARRISVASTDDDRDRGEARGLDSAHAIVCRLIDESSAATERAGS